MNIATIANEKVIVNAPNLQVQAEILEDKIRNYPQLCNRLMPELQKLRAEILIKG